MLDVLDRLEVFRTLRHECPDANVDGSNGWRSALRSATSRGRAAQMMERLLSSRVFAVVVAGLWLLAECATRFWR
jgi:hypothetical protein